MEILLVCPAQIQLVGWTIGDLLPEGEGAGLLVHLDDLLNIFEENLDQSYGRLRPSKSYSANLFCK